MTAGFTLRLGFSENANVVVPIIIGEKVNILCCYLKMLAVLFSLIIFSIVNECYLPQLN